MIPATKFYQESRKLRSKEQNEEENLYPRAGASSDSAVAAGGAILPFDQVRPGRADLRSGKLLDRPLSSQAAVGQGYRIIALQELS
jgi:hypothetical protein